MWAEILMIIFKGDSCNVIFLESFTKPHFQKLFTSNEIIHFSWEINVNVNLWHAAEETKSSLAHLIKFPINRHKFNLISVKFLFSTVFCFGRVKLRATPKSNPNRVKWIAKFSPKYIYFNRHQRFSREIHKLNFIFAIE